jgi:thiol-disulfide isomerase/thioredoxin
LRTRNPNEIRKDIIRREFSEGAVKDELLYQNMLNLLSGSADDERFFKEYASATKDSIYRTEILKKYEVLKLVTPGSEAPQFAYKDQQNKLVTLSSLKGNYVFVNIWATWLNSSLQEIPYLKTIEKKYQNQNIKFVNISIDATGAKDKWARFTRENYPDGIHLLADKGLRSDFIKAFSINTFPRFIIIDTEGKIISANAPRPSSIRLQDTLDKLLFTNLSTCVNCNQKE